MNPERRPTLDACPWLVRLRHRVLDPSVDLMFGTEPGVWAAGIEV